MKNIFPALLIILILSTGCNNNNNKNETINVIYMAQAGYQPDEFKKMTELFEDISGINVNISFVKYDEQHEKILANVKKSQSEYDVFALDLIWTAEFAQKKYCLDLTDKIKEFSDDIEPAIIDAFIYDRKIWAMPFLANFKLFFYNTDMIKKAGFTKPPKTLEDTVDQMKVMKAKGIIKYPWMDSWNEKEGLICDFVWLTGAFGGDITDEKGKFVFNNGAGLKALEFMTFLLKEGLANPISLTSDESMTKDAFISGQCAFTTNWTFQYALMNDPTISKVAGISKMGLLPVSKEILGKYKYDTASVSGFQGLGILSNSKHAEASWKYIKFITSPIVQRAFLQEMTVWTSVQKDPFIQKLDEMMDIKSKEIASVHHRPKVEKYPEASSILQRYIHLALENKMTPKEALDKAYLELNKL